MDYENSSYIGRISWYLTLFKNGENLHDSGVQNFYFFPTSSDNGCIKKESATVICNLQSQHMVHAIYSDPKTSTAAKIYRRDTSYVILATVLFL